MPIRLFVFTNTVAVPNMRRQTTQVTLTAPPGTVFTIAKLYQWHTDNIFTVRGNEYSIHLHKNN